MPAPKGRDNSLATYDYKTYTEEIISILPLVVTQLPYIQKNPIGLWIIKGD